MRLVRFFVFKQKHVCNLSISNKNYMIPAEDVFVPSALQIVRESELASPPNKRRKKLQKWVYAIFKRDHYNISIYNIHILKFL